MSASTILDSGHLKANTEFDVLCNVCTSMFKDKVCLGISRYRYFHHGIYSLSSSAEAGCHICSLMLDQITAADVEWLQHDIDASVVAPHEQIGVIIRPMGNHAYHLKIGASRTSPVEPGKLCGIGALDIRRSTDDHSFQKRSVADINCSSDTVELILSWLSDCETNHTRCSKVQSVAATRHMLPTRLLDLSSVVREGYTKLVTTESLPRDTKYATLSHCWGGGCGKVLSVENMEEMKIGLPFSSIPKSFQQAIILTTHLGVNYLWIDALCIIQNSADDADWWREAAVMGDVYANSHFTLAATTSANSQGGLVHRRDPLSVWPCRLMATWNKPKILEPGNFVVTASGWSRPSDMKPLGDRAWAYQEWLLSRRLIHFSKDQVRWECYCHTASEIYPCGYPEAYFNFRVRPTKMSVVEMLDPRRQGDTHWARMRETYSKKSLTKATDRLAALSGIARLAYRLLESRPEHYLAGLRKERLLQELLWERCDTARQPHDPGIYIAPSWSWASLNGSFQWRYGLGDWGDWGLLNERTQWCAKILSAETFPVFDAFGPVRGGSIIVQCSLIPITLRPPDDMDLSQKSDWELLGVNGGSESWFIRVHLDHLLPLTAAHQEELAFYLAPFACNQSHYLTSSPRLVGLLLRQTQASQGQYRRLGLIDISPRSHDQATMLFLMRQENNADGTAYLDPKLHGPRAIEII